MECTFNIFFSGTAGKLVDTIKSKILSANGRFSGDDSNGSFSIQLMAAAIEGAYTIDCDTITINIQRKPFFIGCNAIRDYITQNLTGQV